ncbi:hypothetical protein RCCS2_10059, partial [Roseobacter sp. CCS2]
MPGHDKEKPMKKHLTLLATATALTASPLAAQDLTVTSFGG